MTDDLPTQLRLWASIAAAGHSVEDAEPIMLHAADRIEQLEKGFRDILTLDDPMLMQMIAKACLTGAIDDQGKYCFVPSAALGEKKDD